MRLASEVSALGFLRVGAARNLIHHVFIITDISASSQWAKRSGDTLTWRRYLAGRGAIIVSRPMIIMITTLTSAGERDFEDLKLLISHQKAKHFKCDRCGRRLNTAGGGLLRLHALADESLLILSPGLSVHLNQVHKETLTQVENALPNRQGLEVEIFGMEGIPAEILDQHRNRIIQNFYQAQEDRRIATGNPLPGQGNKNPRKKIKIETAEELKARLEEHRANMRSRLASGGNGSPAIVPPNGNAFPQEQPQFPPQNFPPPGPPGAQPYPGQQFPAGAFGGLPPRPAGNLTPGAPPGLPQRPTYQSGFYNGPGAPPAFGGASTIDELVSGASQQHGDDIDQLIRMAEAGIKPPRKPEEGVAPPTEDPQEKKSKKDMGHWVYADNEFSPEERMAQMPRYAFVPVQ
jgi:hypothetical protein